MLAISKPFLVSAMELEPQEELMTRQADLIIFQYPSKVISYAESRETSTSGLSQENCTMIRYPLRLQVLHPIKSEYTKLMKSVSCHGQDLEYAAVHIDAVSNFSKEDCSCKNDFIVPFKH